MLSLPPAEQPILYTEHLAAPRSRRFSLEWLRRPESFTLPTSTLRVSPLLTFFIGSGLSAVALTGAFFVFLQPHQPALAQASRQEMALALESAKAPEYVAQADEAVGAAQVEASPLPEVSPSPTTAQLASTTLSSPEEKVYAYHLALAQGFLRKAIDLSQTTKDTQLPSQKQEILQSLEQALQAANKAIESDPRQGAGFLVRARVYKTAAVIKPELSTQSDQDLVIARALGVNAALFGNDTSLLDFLPTQQATQLAGLPVVADAEEGKQTQVQANSTGNANQGKVIMSAGTDKVTVMLPTLKPTQSLRVNPVDASQNRSHAVFSIVNRVDGTSFTIQSSQPLTENLELEWRAIDE